MTRERALAPTQHSPTCNPRYVWWSWWLWSRLPLTLTRLLLLLAIPYIFQEKSEFVCLHFSLFLHVFECLFGIGCNRQTWLNRMGIDRCRAKGSQREREFYSRALFPYRICRKAFFQRARMTTRGAKVWVCRLILHYTTIHGVPFSTVCCVCVCVSMYVFGAYKIWNMKIWKKPHDEEDEEERKEDRCHWWLSWQIRQTTNRDHMRNMSMFYQNVFHRFFLCLQTIFVDYIHLLSITTAREKNCKSGEGRCGKKVYLHI